MARSAKKILYLALICVFGTWLFSLALFCLDKDGGWSRTPVSDTQDANKQAATHDPLKELETKKFVLKFDTVPKNADYKVTVSDGTVKTGKTPFDEMISGGLANITLSFNGYNTLSGEVMLSSGREDLYYLDKAGQIAHHLRNIASVPSPKGIAFSPDGKELWVTMLLNKKRGVSVYDVETGDDVSDIDLDGGGGVELVFSSDGSKVYASQMETAKVYEIDAKTKKVLRVFGTESAWTKVLELSPDGKTIYAANWSGNDVSAIDLETGKLLLRMPSVKTPRGLYAAADGKYLYVAGFDAGEIEKIDLTTGEGNVIYKSGGAMRHFAPDAERGVLFASDMAKNEIVIIDLKTDEVKKFAATDYDPNTIALSPDKNILYVSCRGKNADMDNYYVPGPEWGSVLMFDAHSGAMLDAIVGGNQPTALAVSGDGSRLAFSDFLDNRLEIYELPSYGTFKDGGGGRSKTYRAEITKE